MALPRWTDTDARPLLQGSADYVEHELCLPGLLDQQGHPTSFGCKFTPPAHAGAAAATAATHCARGGGGKNEKRVFH